MNWSSLLLRLKDALSFTQALTIANLVMVGVIAWMSGDFIAAIIENEVLHVPAQEVRYVPPKATIQDEALRFSAFNQVLEQNVFDAEVEQETVPEIVEVAETAAPGKQLSDIIDNLELLGIHYRKNYYIYCIIRNRQTRDEDIFTIGDPVFDTGTTVHRIFTTFGNQRVLIQLGDEIGTLAYNEIEEDTPSSPRETQKASSSSNKKVVQSASSAKLNNKYTSDGKNFYITAEEVDSHLNDFGTLLNQARMVPYFKNGKHQGFRVKAIDEGSLYEKLGLRNNDILKAVNGETLAEAGGEKLMGLFKLLRNEREFTVEIQRSNQSEVLNYYVN